MVVRFAVLMAAVAVLAGCGQKGPLYLPDKGGEVVTRPGGGQAPQQPSTTDDEQKKKDQQQNPSPN
jgi:predicted small lipoprotein YifL